MRLVGDRFGGDGVRVRGPLRRPLRRRFVSSPAAKDGRRRRGSDEREGAGAEVVGAGVVDGSGREGGGGEVVGNEEESMAPD